LLAVRDARRDAQDPGLHPVRPHQLRTHRPPRPRTLTAALTALALAIVPAAAQAPEPFAKSILLIIGLGPGGNYDLWARTLSHHYGKHLPGHPTVVPQYMPGAGSYIAAGHIARIAPRDGSVIALISRDAVLGPLTGTGGAVFDARVLS